MLKQNRKTMTAHEFIDKYDFSITYKVVGTNLEWSLNVDNYYSRRKVIATGYDAQKDVGVDFYQTVKKRPNGLNKPVDSYNVIAALLEKNSCPSFPKLVVT